ncbi:MAG: ABC transporter ATP-binding protein [Lachnospiraceae bacterium]|nr:ABC transporter ATP-binding protein [Lachnospiraceae bacterium]
MKKVFTYYLRPHYLRMLGGLVIKFIGTIMDLFIPYILAHIIDEVIPTRDEGKIFFWGGIMLVCALFAVSFNIIANQKASKVARDTTEKVRHELFAKIMHLSNKQTDFYTKPSLISRLTSDTYNLHQMIGMMQRLGIRAPILLIGGIIITMSLDWMLACVLIAVIPFIGILMISVSMKSIPMYLDLQDSVDGMVRMVREDSTGIRVIKALSKGNYEKEKFAKVNQEVVSKEKKAGTTMAIMNPAVSLLLNAGLVLVIVVGAFRVNNGITRVGKILAFTTYFTIISQAMMAISRMFIIVSKANASAKRIVEIVDCEEDLLLETLDRYEAEDYIVFDKVSFSYNKVEDNLTDISFKIKKGETLGIIGSTGSGKTTLIQLLMRFYDADKGNIYIGGENIKSIPTQKLRQLFGVAFQNDTIFEDTIYENIRLGRDISDEEIREAVFYAQAKEFVNQKNEETEGQLNIRGANLSGGQKQRVLIARALASHPDILVLDDSSSALDYKTDAMLRKEIKEHFSDTTLIVIAQRISSIMNADHILVLEDGCAIGYGTHEELINSCEAYREISISQLGGVAE